MSVGCVYMICKTDGGAADMHKIWKMKKTKERASGGKKIRLPEGWKDKIKIPQIKKLTGEFSMKNPPVSVHIYFIAIKYHKRLLKLLKVC